MKIWETIFILLLTGVGIIAANLVGYRDALAKANVVSFPAMVEASIIGVLVIVGLGVIGLLLSKLPVLKKIPMVAWVSAVAIYVSSPIFPWSGWIVAVTGKVQFMAIATPILAYAGLAIGKDLEMFKKMSWRIIPVALAVCAGTFVFAAVIAHFALKWEGVI